MDSLAIVNAFMIVLNLMLSLGIAVDVLNIKADVSNIKKHTRELRDRK